MRFLAEHSGVGARVRRVYEAARTPLERVQASGVGETTMLARLQAQPHPGLKFFASQ